MDTTLKVLAVAAAFAISAAGTASYAANPQAKLQFVANGISPLNLQAMEGQRVIGKNRELLGHVGKVDEQAKTVELKTPSGAIVPLPMDLLTEDNGVLAAPSLSRGDIIAMIDPPGEAPTIREVGITPTP